MKSRTEFVDTTFTITIIIINARPKPIRLRTVKEKWTNYNRNRY